MKTLQKKCFTFITQECKKAIDCYLNMRERYGEKLTDNSILIREQFDIRDTHQIRKARQLSRDAIRWMTLDIAKNMCGEKYRIPIA